MPTSTVFSAVLLLLAGSALAAPRIDRIAASDEQLTVQYTSENQPLTLAELPVSLTGDPTTAATLSPYQAELSLPRFVGERDRLYSAFQLADTAGEPLTEPHYVNDLSAVSAWDHEVPWPESIKGVTCPVDLEDLKNLGCKHMDTNVMLPSLIDWRAEDPEHYWLVDGERIGINAGYVAQLDAQIKSYTDAGISVTLVLINGVPTEAPAGNPLIHPDTDLAGAPNHLGAFNVTTERGCKCLRAAMEYLASRYSSPDPEHGTVSAYIIGNELQSHWYWHNQGDASLEEIVDDYTLALRIAWLAIRRHHAGVRVYCSLDHCWTSPVDPKPGHSCRGDLLLERLNQNTKAGGDFPWHVAFHPYPENLFEPRYWLDRLAVMGFDAPKITFKNLEVLPAFLRQPRFLFDGGPRRIILSEQGFHCPTGPEGEQIQAAAYAGAYYKTSHMPEIDAFILHRHVDHRAEGGLNLGLWSCKQDGDHPCVPEAKRLIWETFRLADTDQWENAFAFALPIIGIDDWSEALPFEGPIPEDSGVRPAAIDPDALVFDLRARLAEATGEHKGLSWRADTQPTIDGHVWPTIFQHPHNPGEQLASATFIVPLPPVEGEGKLTLRFGTAVVHEAGNGVRFVVLVNGEEVFAADQPAAQSAFHTVDLTEHAGSTVELTLRTDPLGDPGNDWSHWLRPVVVRG